jgi:5-methylcytosine-specific restriction endonuclease McrA
MASRKAGQGSNWIRRGKRLAIYRRDDYRCVYCQRDLATEVATLDHVLACELGGTNDASNLVTACTTCNSSKRDLPLADFLSILADRGFDARTVRARIRRQVRKTLAY